MQRRRAFNLQVFALGFVAGGAFLFLGSTALGGDAGASGPPSDAGVVVLASSPTSARDCAIRAVYHYADDDFGQRALIAAAVLNTALAPDAGLDCGAPPLPSSIGGLPDPYRMQSAIDAVDAVASGSYDVPPACTGVSSVSLPSEAPRSQCVYGGLAFSGAFVDAEPR